MEDEGEHPLDTPQILARRRQFIRLAMFGAAIVVSGGCVSSVCGSPRQLKPGGVFVVYVHDRRCPGCDELRRGDLIQAVDGVEVTTPAKLEAINLADGRPHALTVWDSATKQAKSVEVSIPAGDPLPFWSVGAEQLDRAPSWARRRLWSHASPKLLLVRVGSGEPIHGRELYGRRWLMVMFDWATALDRQHAALCLQVLQKAQADLLAVGVSLIFAQVQHLARHPRAPMTEHELRQFAHDNQLDAKEGGPRPLLPLARMPNVDEGDVGQSLGMEGKLSYVERLGEPPNIFVLDERGIIRWHSAGAIPDPSGDIPVDMVYTINDAVLFARDQL
jgi:hypothetical protein